MEKEVFMDTNAKIQIALTVFRQELRFLKP